MEEAHGQRVRAFKEYKAMTNLLYIDNRRVSSSKIHALALHGFWLSLEITSNNFAYITRRKITQTRIVGLTLEWPASPEQLAAIGKFPNLKYLDCNYDDAGLTPLFSNPDCPILKLCCTGKPETFRCLADSPNNVISLDTGCFNDPLFFAYIKSNKLHELILSDEYSRQLIGDSFYDAIEHATNLQVFDAYYHDEINWARMPKRLTGFTASTLSDGFWEWFAETNMTTLTLYKFHSKPTLDQLRALGVKLTKFKAWTRFSGPQLEMLLHEGSTISELRVEVTSENLTVLCAALTRRGNALRVLQPLQLVNLHGQAPDWVAALSSAFNHVNCMLTEFACVIPQTKE